MITFFDIPSTTPNKAWSPSSCKIRFVLNYKKLPYKTEWIEYPDIEALCKKYGIAPTATKADGSPHYTLPAIYDDKTGVSMADSIPIAEYLDKTYPETPTVLPAGTEAFVNIFIESGAAKLRIIRLMLKPKMPAILSPPSAEYYTRTQSAAFGKPLEDIAPTGEARVEAMKTLEKGFGEVKAWYEKSTGKFIMGDQPTFCDFVLGNFLFSARVVFGEESEEWKASISMWHDGWCAKFLDELREYETVV